MKKTLFILGALLIANYAGAAWSEPTGTPPNNNVPAPINVGATQQNKGEKIGATAFCLPGGLFTDCASNDWRTFITDKMIETSTFNPTWNNVIKNIATKSGFVSGTGTNGNFTKWGPNNTLVDTGISATGLLGGWGVGGHLAGWINNTTLGDSGIPVADLLDGSGTNGSIAKWVGKTTLDKASFSEDDVRAAIVGAGLWVEVGSAVIPTRGKTINNGKSGLKVQIGTPSAPEDGMIWLAQ